jgi:hypothetical protein
MIDIETRCREIPDEYLQATEEGRVNLNLEVMSYIDYNRQAAALCWNQLRAYDNRITITNPGSGAA